MSKPVDILHDKAGVCPVCGGEIVYLDPMDLDDDGVTYPWECSVCGATGKEGYNFVFDRHYSVKDAQGNAISWRPE